MLYVCARIAQKTANCYSSMWSALLAIDQHNRRQINLSIHNGLLPSNNNNNTNSNSTSTSTSTSTSYCEDASTISDIDSTPSITNSRPLIARTLSSSTRSTNNSTSTLSSESEYISVAICSGIWMGETDNYKSGAKDMFR